MPQILEAAACVKVPALGVAADFMADFGDQADRLLLLMVCAWV